MAEALAIKNSKIEAIVSATDGLKKQAAISEGNMASLQGTYKNEDDAGAIDHDASVFVDDKFSCYKELRSENFHFVKIVMCIYRKLLISFKEKMPLFAGILLSIIHALLDQTPQDEMRIIGCGTLFDFVNNQFGKEIDSHDAIIRDNEAPVNEDEEKTKKVPLADFGHKFPLQYTIAMGDKLVANCQEEVYEEIAQLEHMGKVKPTAKVAVAMSADITRITSLLALSISDTARYSYSRSENLFIARDGIQGLKNLVYELDREEGLPHLKYLEIKFNAEIQYIIESMEHNHSNHNAQSQEVYVYKCGKLKSLLPLSIAKKLEKIEVDYCSIMEEVVTYSADQDHHDSIEFPKLKEMKLVDLPNLIGFWPECEPQELICRLSNHYFSTKSFIVMHITMLLHNFYVSMMMVPFPSLESLELGNLNFEGIWLETSLSQLEHLEVQDCGNMEEILVVNSDDQLAQVDLFPKLKHLKLGYRSYESESGDGRQGSRSDIHDHQSNSASAATTFFNPKVIGFPSLETLYLKEVNMERLKYFFPLAIAQCLVQRFRSVSFWAYHAASVAGMRVEAYALFFTDHSLAQNTLQKFQVVGDAD
ncbi:hypothetical protein FNV43_RR02453 [Rhamnella rubrinervis]|uniref:Uncharacterized protein n=1 Tax=Rhamnella rubrinervis TaxID=2594499 RepID=A0A8K0HSN1_9ROSA|nr:hypothetical protein FNV43_RR02453 [Rhamnella rubrinervis]